MERKGVARSLRLRFVPPFFVRRSQATTPGVGSERRCVLGQSVTDHGLSAAHQLPPCRFVAYSFGELIGWHFGKGSEGDFRPHATTTA